MYIISNELYHHGVKGQKWGVRHDKKTFSDQYTQKQYNRDKGVYGTIAAKRLQKKMQDPTQSVQGLRSKEADRIRSFRKAAKIGGIVGGVGGMIGGYIGGKTLQNKYGQDIKNALGNKEFFMGHSSKRGSFGHEAVKLGYNAVDILLRTNGGMVLGGVGGLLAGKYGTEAAIMAIGGYSPAKIKDQEED